MTTSAQNTFPHLPDLHVHGIDQNGTERHISIIQGHLEGDEALLVRLQMMMSRGEYCQEGGQRWPVGLDTPTQARASLRALFQHVHADTTIA